MEVVNTWARHASMHFVEQAFTVTRSRSHRARRIVTFLLFTFASFCLFFQFKLLYQIIFVRPTTIDLVYERKHSLSFPNIVICNLNPSYQKILELTSMFGNVGPLNVQLNQMAVNDLYEPVRIAAKDNLSAMIDKYSVLETQYQYNLNKTDPAFVQLLGCRQLQVDIFRQSQVDFLVSVSSGF